MKTDNTHSAGPRAARLGELARFGVVGVAATAIHYGVYWLLLPVAEKNVAYTAGFAVSFACNYALSVAYTFRVSPSWARLAKFAGSHAVNYAVQISLFNLFCLAGVPPEWVPLPVYAVAVPLNFLLVRLALTRHARRRTPPHGKG